MRAKGKPVPISTEQDGRIVAAIALAQQETRLRAAVEHRDTIGMAKGILMQRHDVDPIRVFRIQHGNGKLHQVATWLVEHRPDL